MKKLIPLFLSGLTIALVSVSCTKEDKPATTSNPIEGKWYFDTTLTTVNGQTNPSAMPFDKAECKNAGKRSSYDFKSGGVLNEVYVTQANCDVQNYVDSWVLTGDKLKITLDTGSIDNYTLVSVNSTALTLRKHTPGSTTSYTDYTFTRQK